MTRIRWLCSRFTSTFSVDKMLKLTLKRVRLIDVQNWKRRYFVLRRHQLRYFRQQSDAAPVKTLDLRQCSECDVDHSKSRPNCFRYLSVFALHSIKFRGFTLGGLRDITLLQLNRIKIKNIDNNNSTKSVLWKDLLFCIFSSYS